MKPFIASFLLLVNFYLSKNWKENPPEEAKFKVEVSNPVKLLDMPYGKEMELINPGSTLEAVSVADHNGDFSTWWVCVKYGNGLRYLDFTNLKKNPERDRLANIRPFPRESSDLDLRQKAIQYKVNKLNMAVRELRMEDLKHLKEKGYKGYLDHCLNNLRKEALNSFLKVTLVYDAYAKARLDFRCDRDEEIQAFRIGRNLVSVDYLDDLWGKNFLAVNDGHKGVLYSSNPNPTPYKLKFEEAWAETSKVKVPKPDRQDVSDFLSLPFRSFDIEKTFKIKSWTHNYKSKYFDEGWGFDYGIICLIGSSKKGNYVFEIDLKEHRILAVTGPATYDRKKSFYNHLKPGQTFRVDFRPVPKTSITSDDLSSQYEYLFKGGRSGQLAREETKKKKTKDSLDFIVDRDWLLPRTAKKITERKTFSGFYNDVFKNEYVINLFRRQMSKNTLESVFSDHESVLGITDKIDLTTKAPRYSGNFHLESARNWSERNVTNSGETSTTRKTYYGFGGEVGSTSETYGRSTSRTVNEKNYRLVCDEVTWNVKVVKDLTTTTTTDIEDTGGIFGRNDRSRSSSYQSFTVITPDNRITEFRYLEDVEEALKREGEKRVCFSISKEENARLESGFYEKLKKAKAFYADMNYTDAKIQLDSANYFRSMMAHTPPENKDIVLMLGNIYQLYTGKLVKEVYDSPQLNALAAKLTDDDYRRLSAISLGYYLIAFNDYFDQYSEIQKSTLAYNLAYLLNGFNGDFRKFFESYISKKSDLSTISKNIFKYDSVTRILGAVPIL